MQQDQGFIYLFIYKFCDIVKLPIITRRFNQFGYRPNVNVEKS
jgi:hypothetical protein